MTTQRFDLMLTGKPLPGHDRKGAVAALARVLQLPEAGAGALLKGREQVVMRNLDDMLLARYVAALQAAGVAMRAVPVAAVDAPAADPAQREKRIRELEALTRELNAAQPYQQDQVTCACCGSRYLRSRASAKPCLNCGWQDDPQQRSDEDRVLPGINRGLSLRRAREEYETYGSLDPGRYRPNSYPLRQRVKGGVIALLAMAYCGWSLWRGEMFLFASIRFASAKVHSSTLLGSEVWLMSGGLLFAVMVGVLMIADHYDRRRNEHLYLKAGQACYLLIVVFVGLALTLHSYRTDGLSHAVPIGLVMSAILTVVIVRRKDITLKSN